MEGLVIIQQFKCRPAGGQSAIGNGVQSRLGYGYCLLHQIIIRVWVMKGFCFARCHGFYLLGQAVKAFARTRAGAHNRYAKAQRQLVKVHENTFFLCLVH